MNKIKIMIGNDSIRYNLNIDNKIVLIIEIILFFNNDIEIMFLAKLLS